MSFIDIKQQFIALDAQKWPPFKKSVRDMPRLEGLVGLDLEYNPETQEPYMFSLACKGVTMSAHIQKGSNFLKTLPTNPNIKLCGHNILGADLEVLHNYFGTPRLPSNLPIDTIISYYLMNQHLCQGFEDKEAEGIQFERGSGKLNLSSMASQYLNMGEYKTCRGPGCVGPCPEHQESWYNAIDALAPIDAWREMKAEAKTFTSSQFPEGVPLQKLHDHLLRVQHALNKIGRAGIYVDRERVAEVEAEIEADKLKIFPQREEPRYGKRGQLLKNPEIVYAYGFNPESPKQVKEFFAARGISLAQANAECMAQALKSKKDKVSEKTLEAGQRYLEYKLVGRGVSNWFAPKYIDADSYQRPRWSAFGGAMVRPVSADPNVQNIPKRGSLRKARSCWAAPPGMKILKADCKQGEPRVMMFLGGVDAKDIPLDVYDFVIEQSGDLFEQVAKRATEFAKIIPYKGLPTAIRAATKRTVMAYLYGEGMYLVEESQFSNPRSRFYKDFKQGTLNVHHDWHVNGKVVCFDGKHLAQDFYGNESPESRRIALDVQKRLADSVPSILRTQKETLAESERGYVMLPSGRLFQLVQDERKNLKTALAFKGQGTLAEYMEEALLIYDDLNYLPAIYIHDEFGFYVPEDWDKKKCLDFLHPMSHESKIIQGGFIAPTDAEWGPNYFDLVSIED